MTTAPPIDPTLRGESILLVAPDSRGLLEFTFRNLGAKTITAENVPDAQREIDGHRPDLIISDIALPDAEGFHVR